MANIQGSQCCVQCLLCLLVVFSSLALWLLLVEWQKDETFNCTADASSLEQVVSCILEKMPQRKTQEAAAENGVEPKLIFPTDVDIFDFSRLINSLLVANWEEQPPQSPNCPILLATSSLYRYYTVIEFQAYCILLEKSLTHGTATLGWGSFIFKKQRSKSGTTRTFTDVIVQVPHPLTDGETALQGATILERAKTVQALMIAGTTRNASTVLSSCISGFFETDVAHTTNNLMHAATIQVLNSFKTRQKYRFAFVQLHGMAESSCPGTDVFITAGVATPSTLLESRATLSLKRELRRIVPNWNVTSASDPFEDISIPSCRLHGTANVQGRFLNLAFHNSTSVDVCSQKAHKASNWFVHIEQKRAAREAHIVMAEAIDAAFFD